MLLKTGTVFCMKRTQTPKLTVASTASKSPVHSACARGWCLLFSKRAFFTGSELNAPNGWSLQLESCSQAVRLVPYHPSASLSAKACLLWESEAGFIHINAQPFLSPAKLLSSIKLCGSDSCGLNMGRALPFIGSKFQSHLNNSLFFCIMRGCIVGLTTL